MKLNVWRKKKKINTNLSYKFYNIIIHRPYLKISAMLKEISSFLGLLCSFLQFFFSFSFFNHWFSFFKKILSFINKSAFIQIYLLYRRRSSPPLSRLLLTRSLDRSRLRSVERFLLLSLSRSRSLSRSFSRFSRSFLRSRSRSSSILFCSSIFRWCSIKCFLRRSSFIEI